MLSSMRGCCDGGDLAVHEVMYDYARPCDGSYWEDLEDASALSPTSRARGSACLCAASPHEKMSQDKLRLKGMAVEFFKRAEQGIPLQVVDPCTGRLVPCVFRIDSCFQNCFFSAGPPFEHVVRLHDLDEPRKGTGAGGCSEDCVVIRAAAGSRCFVCRFPSAREAGNFFSCMSILRLSVLIAEGLSASPQQFVGHC